MIEYGADGDVAVELRLVDEGGGMDQAHVGLASGGLDRCAWRTAARPRHHLAVHLRRALNFAMPRFRASIVDSRISWSPGTTGRLKRAPSMPTK